MSSQTHMLIGARKEVVVKKCLGGLFECASEHLEEREHDDPEDEEGDGHHLVNEQWQRRQWS